MDWQVVHKQEIAFLQEQLQTAQRKVDRVRQACLAAGNPPGDSGMQAMLRAAQGQCDLINDLLTAHQKGEGKWSLESLILCKLKQHSRQAAAQHAHNWRRGSPTPPAYWDAEVTRSMLSSLLSRYHTWRREVPNDVDVAFVNRPRFSGRQPLAFPWYAGEDDPTESQGPNRPAPEALERTIGDLFQQNGHAGRDLHVIAQADGWVLIFGAVYDQADKNAVLALVENVPGVKRILSFLRIVPS